MEEVAFTRHMRESWDQEELGSISARRDQPVRKPQTNTS